MKILQVKSLAIPEVKVIQVSRFPDHRGYFTELFKKSDYLTHPALSFMKNEQFLQNNESYSQTGTARGLHFQWNPYTGKLVRTVMGRMIDMVLDIRKGSPTFGKILLYDMPSSPDKAEYEWIWVPVGFAHGNFFTENTLIEYYCTGEYSPTSEAGISPIANDIDWSLVEPRMKQLFDKIVPTSSFISDKDKNGFSVEQWAQDSRSNNFRYQ
jgi:dTDP-4-dehydrorhamnose 3,5-epimerase